MSNLSTKLADATVLSKPQLPDLSKRLLDYTGAEFLQLLLGNQPTIETSSPEPQKSKRFVDSIQARCRLSGNDDKPISAPTFNKLRREGLITTHFPSPGRVAFDLDEIDAYLSGSGTGKGKSILTKKKNR